MDVQELYEYSKVNRRKIHEYPELGFDLDRTVALVSGELEKYGIPYTYKYGRGSVVCEIGDGDRIIALRADMDALPVEEKTDLPYKSKIPGRMHACGHDAHTAILLSVARYLKENEERLSAKFRLIFQPSEECADSGAKLLVENGVVDGVDHIIATHCENGVESGQVGLCYGDYMAACVPVSIRFLGRTSHATLPEFGIDAVAMAVEAYGSLKAAVEREANGTKYIWTVGRFEGGKVHNVIADSCELDVSFRYFDGDFADRVESRVRDICRSIAEKYGGRVEISWNMSTGAVHNDETLARRFEDAVSAAGITVAPLQMRMSSEDFARYLERVPGLLFRFGTRNEEKGCTAMAHRNDFTIDEEGMRCAIAAFVAYIENFTSKM